MNALMSIVCVLLFIVGLAASVGLHEAGHLIPGKLFNIKVTQYFVGFGRTLWSFRKGETEYGFKAVPLGGYVKLVGMIPPSKGDLAESAEGSEDGVAQVRSRATGMFAQLIDDARSGEYEEVGPHDHHRLFYNQAWWKRVIVMGCGVSINIVLAFFLFAIAFMGYGVQTPTTTVGTVFKCVKVVETGQSAGECTAKDPASPAYEMGLRPGDRVLSINGQSVSTYDQVQRLIRANSTGGITLVIDRDGTRKTLHANTVVNELPSLSGSGKMVKAGFVGIQPTQELQRQSIGYVGHTMVTGTWETLTAIGTLPSKVYHVARAALHLEKRDPNSIQSIVGAGRIAGEIGASDDISAGGKIISVVVILAGLNLFLGLVNLVPLPPFDGAGIATTIYEVIRRGIARLLGRPDPGGVDSAKLLPVTYAMAVVIMVVGAILIVADIVAPVHLPN